MPGPGASLRTLLAALALLGVAGLGGCQLSPSGSCEADRDCENGRHCAESVCVPDGRSDLYAGCVVDRDCDLYAECMRGVCVLAAGRCTDALDCAAWERCEENVCLPQSGRCGTLEDCAAWEICIAAASAVPPLPEHRCAPAPGRCAAATDCSAWQQCTSTRFCEAAPGFCAGNADCQAWEACGATSHTCGPLPGRCGATADCATWQTCGADHVCALRAGSCGVQDDCSPELVCQANACVAQPAPPTLDPGAIHLVGTLAPGTPGRGAIAPVGAPLPKLVGLAEGDDACGARLGRDGRVVLTRGATLATLVPDALVWDASADLWVYPAAPAANDQAVSLPPGCEGAVSVAVVLQAGTDARLVGCDGVWRDATGLTIAGGMPLLGWSASGGMLSGTAEMLTAPVLLDAAGLEIPLSGDLMPDGDRLVSWRADGDGFRVIRALGATPGAFLDLEVWTIDASGAAARAAPLPVLPAEAASVSAPLLDVTGAVFQLGVNAAGDGLVVKRTPGGAAEIVYDEATLAPGTSLLDAPVRVEASCLLTGP